jgi:hypothetical protein
MSKSAIYTANTSNQTVDVNGIINLGTIVRRYGPNVNLSGNAIQIDGAGYYDIDVSVTAAPTAAGAVTVTMYENGVAIQGASATSSTTTANNSVNISITSLVREFCSCCEGLSNLTFVLSGTEAVVSNIAVVVKKI